jgi:hypothetical protein
MGRFMVQAAQVHHIEWPAVVLMVSGLRRSDAVDRLAHRWPNKNAALDGITQRTGRLDFVWTLGPPALNRLRIQRTATLGSLVVARSLTVWLGVLMITPALPLTDRIAIGPIMDPAFCVRTRLADAGPLAVPAIFIDESGTVCLHAVHVFVGVGVAAGAFLFLVMIVVVRTLARGSCRRAGL